MNEETKRERLEREHPLLTAVRVDILTSMHKEACQGFLMKVPYNDQPVMMLHAIGVAKQSLESLRASLKNILNGAMISHSDPAHSHQTSIVPPEEIHTAKVSIEGSKTTALEDSKPEKPFVRVPCPTEFQSDGASNDAEWPFPSEEVTQADVDNLFASKKDGRTSALEYPKPDPYPHLSDSEQFIMVFRAIQFDVHRVAKEKGWWEKERNDAEVIALMHSELSEALEAMRAGNPPDDKVPEYSGVEAELADVIIRIMDYAAGRGFKVAEALVAKHEMNQTREYKHGGKEF